MKKAIIFVLIGLFVINAGARARELAGSDAVKNLNVLFLKGEYAAVINNSKDSLSHYRFQRTEKKEILRLAALSYMMIGDFRDARKVFQDILDMKGGEFREDAYIGIADSYFYAEDFDKAIQSYKAVLDMFPKSERTSSVYYNLALSYKKKKDFNKANYCFSKIQGEYRDSFEADSIRYAPVKEEVRYYIIQFGAFESLRRAKILVKKLAKKGYDSYVQKIRQDGKILYRVRGGKFSNESYAKKLLRKLKRDKFTAKIIIE